MLKTLKKIQNFQIIPYNDYPVRLAGALVAALLIVSFDEPENWYELLYLPAFYPALIASTIMAFIIIETIFRFNRWLDRLILWFTQPARRLLLQVLLCVILPLAISVSLAASYYGWYNYSLDETVYFDKHFMPIVIMVISANLYYILQFSIHLLHHVIQHKRSPPDINLMLPASSSQVVQEVPRQTRSKAENEVQLHMPNGLSLDTIELVFSLNRNVWVLHGNEKTSWLNTIQKTMLALPAQHYFLANKSCIVKRSNILAAYYVGQRRILLRLHTNKVAEVYVGRNHKTRFVAWYHQEIYPEKNIPNLPNSL